MERKQEARTDRNNRQRAGDASCHRNGSRPGRRPRSAAQTPGAFDHAVHHQPAGTRRRQPGSRPGGCRGGPAGRLYDDGILRLHWTGDPGRKPGGRECRSAGGAGFDADGILQAARCIMPPPKPPPTCARAATPAAVPKISYSEQRPMCWLISIKCRSPWAHSPPAPKNPTGRQPSITACLLSWRFPRFRICCLGAGLLHGSRILSYEMLLMDSEIWSILHALYQGITVNDVDIGVGCDPRSWAGRKLLST